MSGILWHMEQKLEGILDRILMEFHMWISEDKNQFQKSMYIPWYLSSSFYSRVFFVTLVICSIYSYLLRTPTLVHW